MFNICFAQNYKIKCFYFNHSYSIVHYNKINLREKFLIWMDRIEMEKYFESSEFEMMIWMVALVQKTNTVHSQLGLINLLVLTWI